MPKISIVVRTYNEERWIEACLRKIQSQTIEDTEVILVDNYSTDKTIQRAKNVMPDLKLVKIKEYLPGKSLNLGIRKAAGEYIVCVSSHCIPKYNYWLEVMLSNFENDPLLAGVYGRQIPMHFTNSHDKRDLIVTFGLDRRVQKKDPFFHNANSMIPLKVWDQFQFDEQTTNIEDRLWAKEVLNAGYHLIYEPEAPVYHHHGIYQNRNEDRLRNVLRIIGEDPEDSIESTVNPFHEENLMIGVIIPIREEENLDFHIQCKLLDLTIQEAKRSPSVDRVFVTTDSDRLAKKAVEFGAEVPFIRPKTLSSENISVLNVLQHALEELENRGQFFDYIATMEITHPFRPKDILQKCVEHAIRTGLESVIAGMAEYRPGWWLKENEYRRIDNYLKKRSEREPIHIGLPAVCTVLTPSLIRNGFRIGERTGIVEVSNPMTQIEIRKTDDYQSLMNLENFI